VSACQGKKPESSLLGGTAARRSTESLAVASPTKPSADTLAKTPARRSTDSFPAATPSKRPADTSKPAKKRKSVGETSNSASDHSCYICSKAYKNVKSLKVHYVRAHFYAALLERYVGDAQLGLTSLGEMTTCKFCPFR